MSELPKTISIEQAFEVTLKMFKETQAELAAAKAEVERLKRHHDKLAAQLDIESAALQQTKADLSRHKRAVKFMRECYQAVVQKQDQALCSDTLNVCDKILEGGE